MKVCHITSVHHLNDGRICEKECTSLSENGHEVYLVGAGDFIPSEKVNIISVSKKQNRIKRFFFLDKAIVEKAISLNCDIYHLHDPELLRYALRIKKRGCKVIFDSHEDIPRQIESKRWIPCVIRQSVAHIYEKFEKTICKKLDMIIVATDKIRSAFETFGIKAEVIFNYPILGSEPVVFKEKKDNILCFAGGLYESNGIKQLIDVVCELDMVKLIIAGPIEDHILEYVKNKNCRRIEYLGIISKSEVKKLYDTSTIGVVADLPTGNNVDGLPIKLFEYMNAGIPIITSDFPIRREMFNKYLCGRLINPFNIEEYKKAVVSILEDKRFQKECCDNGIRAVKTEYNWKSQGEKINNIYDMLEGKNA